MNLRGALTRKNTIIGSIVLVVGLVVAGFFALRRPPRVAMDRYVPAEALAFVEINSLADLVGGLTSTKAWRELAPVLGLSSQLRQVGLVTDLIGRSGLGPDEAVVAGRAQYAIAITAIESNAGETDDGPYLHLKPAFALIIETHTKPETATRLVRERASMIAQRIYGESVVEHADDYRGSQMRVFEGPGPGHQLVASSEGSVILIANQADAMKQCLDAIAGRAATLAEDTTLKQMRPEVGRDPSIFAYVTAAGIENLVDLWPLLVAGTAAEPETVGTFADLIEHLSKQAGAGLLYSLEFEADGVTEKYLTVLRPQIAEALTQPLKSASAAGFESLAIIPRGIEGMTLLSVENAGDLPERVFKQLSPTVDIVAGVALREFVINLKKQYGLEPSDSVGDAIGSEIALVNFGDDQPRAMLIRVNDRPRLAPMVNKYVTRMAASLTNEQHNGTEILVSSDDDRRAAAFVGDFLVLGTRDQIVKVIETNAKRDGQDGDEQLKQVLSTRPANASIIHHRARVEDAGKLLLAISKLTRVTDGSLELMDRDSARKALDRLPHSISFTEFRDYGVYTQSHSAVG
ncbi:MAG TPA: hypothetical protein VI837_12205, partial [Blastocatellia bacterium]|nr:hypothetical protein [Blastocatellia bacterium]